MSCRRSSIQRCEYGWEAVKDVSGNFAACVAECRVIAFNMAAATNLSFNRMAHSQAAVPHIDLNEFDGLAALLEARPIKGVRLNPFC
jgi:hypothetical protein